MRRVIEPMLAGTLMDTVPEEDRQYLVDLGLLRRDSTGGLVVANPIYREVLPRTLAITPQATLPQIAPTWLNPDGRLNPDRLLDAPQAGASRSSAPEPAATKRAANELQPYSGTTLTRAPQKPI